ncbi:phosphate ABC transporter permease PstA [Methanogenium marinum]|uniref:Phosphate ABC transporter permease PstA n=1 Tax=Methanogenium marinum TaxID=348610 RepID=A0A9Q4PVZ7_9EURY|nr:phosphate ABC transporter permease PstA [Methanogenium marinum]
MTAVFGVLTVFFILAFLVIDGIPIFATVSPVEFLFGTTWNPTGAIPAYGTLPLWIGTVLVTIGAMVIAAPLGIACAIVIAELASPRLKAVFKPATELLAGIPSVVYGFFGLIVLTDFIRVNFDIPTGETWLAGSVLLGIMALPTIISVSEDAISAVPKEYREGSLALGTTRWQTISQVIVPSALSGITAALILGIGRAVGETMAVLMVTGNAAIIPDPIYNVLSPIRTLTGTLGIEMGETAIGSAHYHALFGVALLLLLITLAVNLSATVILGHIHAKQTGSGKGPGRLSALLARYQQNLKIAAVAFILLLVAFFVSPLVALVFALIGAALWYIPSHIQPRHQQNIAFSLLYVAIAVVLAALAIILGYIVINGLPAINWEFLTTAPRALGREGGIFPAIIGTLYLVTGAIAIALPIGVGAAIYLIEYTRENILTKLIRTGVDLLNGTPSIVFGLFGFSFLVLYLNLGISLIAGQITLALMVLPTVIRTTEEALRSVPTSFREGSLALGATQWQTISRVVIPPAIPGIITGAILSIGRAAGETAPIMFTAVVFSSRYLPSSLSDPVMALPYHLYILATNVPGAETNQYGTALVLITMVVGIYLVAIAVRTHYQKSIRW